MTQIFAAIGRFSVRWRYLIVVIWLVGTAAAVVTLPTLSSAVKDNNGAFLPASSPSQQANRLASALGYRSNVFSLLVVAARPTSPLTAADQEAIARVARAARQVPGAVGVRTIALSGDGQAAELDVRAHIDTFSETASKAFVGDLRAAIARARPPGGLDVHLAGPLATAVDNAARSNNNGNQVQTISLVFILVLLLLVFRSLLAPILTLLPAALAVQLAGPLVAESARAGVQVSSITQVLLIVLVLGAGTDYGLFLVFRVREELRGGAPPKEAVSRGLTRVGESITFSAATVIAALLSLLLATFGFYRSLGVPLAIGIALILLAGLTLLPALLAIFGRATFWPSNVRPGVRRVGIWGRIAPRIVRRPALTLIVGLVVLGGLAAASIGNKPSGFGGTPTAPSGSDSAEGQAALAAHFPKTSSNPTSLIFRFPRSVYDEPSGLATVQADLARAPVLSALVGPLDPNGTALSPAQLTSLHSRLGPPRLLPPAEPSGLDVPLAAYNAYRTTAALVSPDGRTVQWEAALSAGDPSTTAALNSVPAVRAVVSQAARHAGAVAGGVAGEAPVSYDVGTISSHDLRRIVPLAIVFIAILLALVMRSMVAPLYLIASVLLSFLAALGLAVVIFIDLGSDSGLTFFLPFLMFIFLLALGEDYNILIMTRIREEAKELPLDQAITRALTATGTTVTSAGLVLAGTFGVLAVVGSGSGGSNQLVVIGVALSAGILMDSFIVRTLLVPSVVALLGRWNWWPSSLSRPDHLETRPTMIETTQSVV